MGNQEFVNIIDIQWRVKMSSKPTYNDFQSGKPEELKKTYKLNDRQLEMAKRDVMYGATQSDMRKEYDKFYRRNRRDA